MRRHCLGPLPSVWTLRTEVDWPLPVHVGTLKVLWVVSRIVSLWVSAKSQKSPLAAIQFNWCLTPGKVHIEKKSILFKILHLKNFIEKKKSVSVWNLTPTKVHIGKKSDSVWNLTPTKVHIHVETKSVSVWNLTHDKVHVEKKNQFLFEIHQKISSRLNHNNQNI